MEEREDEEGEERKMMKKLKMMGGNEEKERKAQGGRFGLRHDLDEIMEAPGMRMNQRVSTGACLVLITAALQRFLLGRTVTWIQTNG